MSWLRLIVAPVVLFLAIYTTATAVIDPGTNILTVLIGALLASVFVQLIAADRQEGS